MYWYKNDVGKYAKKAGRLSALQHGVYTLLRNACYDRESFPTMAEAIEWAWLSSPEEIAAIEFVLTKLFDLVDAVYIERDIEIDLAEYHQKRLTNKAIAIQREANRRKPGNKSSTTRTRQNTNRSRLVEKDETDATNRTRPVNEPSPNVNDEAQTVNESPPNVNESPPNYQSVISNQENNSLSLFSEPRKTTVDDWALTEQVCIDCMNLREDLAGSIDWVSKEFILHMQSEGTELIDWDARFKKWVLAEKRTDKDFPIKTTE